jgi:hypothetical protein
MLRKVICDKNKGLCQNVLTQPLCTNKSVVFTFLELLELLLLELLLLEQEL